MSNMGKNNYFIAPKLFRILGTPIIFSATVCKYERYCYMMLTCRKKSITQKWSTQKNLTLLTPPLIPLLFASKGKIWFCNRERNIEGVPPQLSVLFCLNSFNIS